MDQREYRIHCAIIKHLDSAWPRIEYTHAGKARDATHAHFLNQMGYTAGTGDVIWYCQGKFGEMEVKDANGTQSPEQRTRQNAVQRNGGAYVVVRSVREAHDYFLSLGLIPMHNACPEPDMRSNEEKKRDAINFYRPVQS